MINLWRMLCQDVGLSNREAAVTGKTIRLFMPWILTIKGAHGVTAVFLRPGRRSTVLLRCEPDAGGQGLSSPMTHKIWKRLRNCSQNKISWSFTISCTTWTRGCICCSRWTDNGNGVNIRLNHLGNNLVLSPGHFADAAFRRDNPMKTILRTGWFF